MKKLFACGVFCALLCTVGFAPALLWGQANQSGSISGLVTDQSGGVIVGAEVTLTDAATKATRQLPTNGAGRFIFTDLPPGTYDVAVAKVGFRRLTAPGQVVTLSKTLSLTLAMEVGATTQVVEVKATPGAELQTTSSTFGSTMDQSMLMNLPSTSRDVSSLLNFQATAAPTFHGAEGDITGGSIAGSTPDQNTFILDGVTNTSGLEGDNGYINGFSGDQRGVVPTPVESIAEVTVNTNNATSDFSTSSGGELLAVTKRGHDVFHGAAYNFFQGDWLNSNDWGNNFTGVTKPKSHQNRFGFDVGGPMLPRVLGGKTYFFFNYEGQRYPFNVTGKFTRTVPSDALRKGIIQIRTSQGVQSFDFSNPASLATACGTTTSTDAAGNTTATGAGLPCDPRGIGVSSVVSTMWSQYMPEPNSFNTNGDKLNTFAYRSTLTLPLNNNILIGRIDHDFGSKFRWYTRYTWYKQDIPTTNEVDIGGLLKGDTKGVAASASSNNNQPAVVVTGLDATITPTLTNSFHFGYTRNEWNWIRNGVQTPQIAGSAGAIEIDGESTNALIPVNIDTQNSRNRAWYEHNYDFRDELTWLKGNHVFQFGGDVLHEWWHFNRFDNVVGGLTNLVYEVDNGSVKMTSAFQPQPCAGSVAGATATTNCIDYNDASELSKWNQYYADLLGIVNHSSVVATRTGANLALNPIGTPAASYVTVNTPSIYINDSWKARPSLTFNFGLNYVVQMPPHDINGRQDVLVDASNNPITYDNYVANRIAAANNGQIYNPVVGFTPVGAVGAGSKYAFKPYYGQIAPRVSVAWSPSFDSGWLGTLFGHKTTVIRGGYGRFYGRDLGINVISNPVLGDGFLQPVSCVPTMTGGCTSVRGVTPATAFRIGSNADGLNVPLPAIAPTLSVPVQPGIGTTPSAELTDSMDQNFRPNNTDQIDFSIQRQLKGDMIIEVGYLGVWGQHLFQGIDMNAVPWMMKLGGQTFAQAYANIWQQVHAGVPVTAQPFFETAMTAGGNTYCQGAPNCSAALASNLSSYLTSEDVVDFWSGMEGNWTLGNALYTDSGQSTAYGPYANTSDGFSNYQAMVVKFTKRTSKGLTMNANMTWGHALGTIGLAQTYTLDTPDNVYCLRCDWTPQPWDRKLTINLAGTYLLPFGPGQHWSSSNGILSRLIGGWSVSPLFSFGSGLPAEFYTGSFLEMGAGYAENGASAVPMTNTANLSNSPHNGVVLPEPSATSDNGNPNSVGVNGNPDNGGTGANMFGANAIKVFNSFRPFVLGLDNYPNPDGQLRGPQHWVLDLGITKETKITERVGLSFYTQMINAFNHTNWSVSGDLNLQDPNNFGVMSGGYGSLGNYGRVIELGMRVSF
ncbi:MAG TPA: carboxypeptidase regulatory-like domain-containing protein [Terriglobia bacterium]|nr:carboxypeptidase regulatory-like domain-containing protein [Terriglobia bacterium]